MLTDRAESYGSLMLKCLAVSVAWGVCCLYNAHLLRQMLLFPLFIFSYKRKNPLRETGISGKQWWCKVNLWNVWDACNLVQTKGQEKGYLFPDTYHPYSLDPSFEWCPVMWSHMTEFMIRPGSDWPLNSMEPHSLSTLWTLCEINLPFPIDFWSYVTCEEVWDVRIQVLLPMR